MRRTVPGGDNANSVMDTSGITNVLKKKQPPRRWPDLEFASVQECDPVVTVASHSIDCQRKTDFSPRMRYQERCTAVFRAEWGNPRQT